ncbi:MAG: YCF48-related protein [Ignavibacteriaceae bacterium]|nr:YCF48-related protein [Ignavibacteriaceae bacterium]
MKKFLKIVFYFIFLFSNTSIFAQDIQVNVIQSHLSEPVGVFEIVFNFTIVNISPSEQIVFEVRTINDLPPDWSSSLCFELLCFPPDIDSIATTAYFNTPPLQPGDTLESSVHIFTDEISIDSAHVQIEIGTFQHPEERIPVDFYAVTTGGSITVISPNGGEIWRAGEQYEINWSSQEVTNVKIDYSTDSGVSWIPIINSTPSIGSYTWSIPNTPSNDCKVKISDVAYPFIFDESDSLFSIPLIPTITLISPNGGEEFQGTTTENISFVSTFVDSVMIEFSPDAGTTWELVYSSIPASGNIDWLIPNITSENCKIKVTDTEDFSVFDFSNAVFSITEVGWYKQNSTVSNRLTSIDMWNSMVGYCCGLDGTILRTTNGGFTWESLSTGIVEGLNSIKFISENIGWVVGQDGKILKTTNGGLSWSYQISNTTKTLNSVFFINENVGWVVGWDGTILKTSDSGNNWITQQSSIAVNLNSVFFYSSDLGWTVGELGACVKTTNGGETWVQKTTGTNNDLNSISFANSETGVIAGMEIILQSNDSGEIWTDVSPTYTNCYSISFSNTETGYIVGAGGKIFKSTDGVSEWFIIGSGIYSTLYDVTFTDVNTGWAVGQDGTIIKTLTGGTGYVITNLIVGAQASNQFLEVSTIEGFSIDDNILINPGGTNQETNKIDGFGVGIGSILLELPLQYNHQIGELVIKLNPTSVEEEFIYELPTEFTLLNNYPNPFNPSTKITFSLAADSKVSLKVFDVLGQEVASLINQGMTAGVYSVDFNAVGFPSGVYFYRIEATGVNNAKFVDVKKMILLK